MDEMTVLEDFRSQVPRPGSDDLRAEEARLMAAVAGPTPRPKPARRRLVIGLAAGMAAASVTAAITSVPGNRSSNEPPRIMPAAASEVLTKAAAGTGSSPELHPKAGQYLVYESQTMDPVESNSNGRHARYLARTVRKVWMPIEGDATKGFIQSRSLPPKAYPGWPIPPEAHTTGSATGPQKLADFDNKAEFLRNDYAYVSHLPTTPQKMYEHLYTRLGRDAQADNQAWQRVGGLLTETYLPAAQRAALYRAAAAIPGVTTVPKATDAAGREGIAAAKVIGGIREEYIFDRRTYQYLGQRSIVTDPTQAQAPTGTTLTSTAQLKISLTTQPPH